MVRTYSYNPSTGQERAPVAADFRKPSLNMTPSDPTPSQQIVTASYNQEISIPSLNQNPFYHPFHSPHIDPVGSIIGLRVVYVEGKICYVPVEPQINYLINRQFAVNAPVFAPALQNSGVVNGGGVAFASPLQLEKDAYNNNSNGSTGGSHSTNSTNSTNPSARDGWFQLNPQPQNGRRGQWTEAEQNQNFYATPPRATLANSTSVPNLSRKLTDKEQHQLELARQIEDNKRRKEEEKRKEWELEQKEIRRHEQYLERIRREDEEEKRKAREKALAIERRQQTVAPPEPAVARRKHSQPQREFRSDSPPIGQAQTSRRYAPSPPLAAAQPQTSRRYAPSPPLASHTQQNNARFAPSPPPQDVKPKKKFYAPSPPPPEEPMRRAPRRTANPDPPASPPLPTHQNRAQTQSPPIPTMRNRSQSQVSDDRRGTGDSSAPRKQEWWEKKPTYSNDGRKSPVIPTMRKPPQQAATSGRQSRLSRQSYNPSDSVQQHENERRNSAASIHSRRDTSRPPSNANKE